MNFNVGINQNNQESLHKLQLQIFFPRKFPQNLGLFNLHKESRHEKVIFR